MGYLTIKFKELEARWVKKQHGNFECDVMSKCDPYIKLNINNGKEVFTSEIQNDTATYDFGIVYTSKEIQKNISTVEIVVKHFEGNDDLSKDDTIMDENYSVDSFLKEPARITSHSESFSQAAGFSGVSVDHVYTNSLETTVFWKDIYNYLNCTTPKYKDGDSGAVVPKKNCTSSRLYQDQVNHFSNVF